MLKENLVFFLYIILGLLEALAIMGLIITAFSYWGFSGSAFAFFAIGSLLIFGNYLYDE